MGHQLFFSREKDQVARVNVKSNETVDEAHNMPLNFHKQ